MRMMNVVEAEPALDAKPVVVRRAIASLGVDDLLVLDLIGHLAADAAEGTKRIDFPVGVNGAGLMLVEKGGGHQRAGRAGLNAFAAGDAGGFAHRIVEVEDDLGVVVAIGHADDVIDLHFAAAAQAKAALDAGVEIDAHGGMAGVADPARRRREPAPAHLDPVGPMPELRIRVVRGRARRLVRDQKLHDHLARLGGALGRRFHFHAGGRRPLAGRGQHALALDLDHAGAAIAVGAIAGLGRIAKMRNFGPHPLGDLPDGFAGGRLDLPAVEFEVDLVGHFAAPFGANSSGKYLMTVVSGLEAA